MEFCKIKKLFLCILLFIFSGCSNNIEFQTINYYSYEEHMETIEIKKVQGKVVKQTNYDANGIEISYTDYSDNGKTTKTYYPSKEIIIQKFDDNGNLILTQKQINNEIKYIEERKYNDKSQLLSQLIEQDGSKTIYCWEYVGELIYSITTFINDDTSPYMQSVYYYNNKNLYMIETTNFITLEICREMIDLIDEDSYYEDNLIKKNIIRTTSPEGDYTISISIWDYIDEENYTINTTIEYFDKEGIVKNTLIKTTKHELLHIDNGKINIETYEIISNGNIDTTVITEEYDSTGRIVVKRTTTNEIEIERYEYTYK